MLNVFGLLKKKWVMGLIVILNIFGISSSYGLQIFMQGGYRILRPALGKIQVRHYGEYPENLAKHEDVQLKDFDSEQPKKNREKSVMAYVDVGKYLWQIRETQEDFNWINNNDYGYINRDKNSKREDIKPMKKKSSPVWVGKRSDAVIIEDPKVESILIDPSKAMKPGEEKGFLDMLKAAHPINDSYY